MVASFVAATLGATSFAAFPGYIVAVTSLFVIGTGMAALQVAINPLLRVAVGRSTLHSTQRSHSSLRRRFLRESSGLFRSREAPRSAHRDLKGLYALLGSITPPALPWASIYWIFAAVSGVCVVVIALLRLPKVERTAEESAGTLSMYRQLLRNPIVWLYFFAVIAYVGCEQARPTGCPRFSSAITMLIPQGRCGCGGLLLGTSHRGCISGWPC